MKDIYIDSILGEWKLVKKTKKELLYERRAQIKLHESNKIPYTDPKDFKEYNIWGDVVLIHGKVHDIETGIQSLFKSVELTGTTAKSVLIK